MEEVIKQIDRIEDKKNFLIFMDLLIKDLKENPEEWANKKIDEYLEAIMSWTEDMEGYYENNNLPIPEKINWKVFATILIAAKMYE
ncbi:MAG: hypothetical protein ABIR15_21175 [Chitinophagaceae bacterium]